MSGTESTTGCSAPAADGATGTVLVRSDQVVLAPAGSARGNAPARPPAAGTVIARTFYGHDQLVTVLLDAAPQFPGGVEPPGDPATSQVAWQVQARCAGDEHLIVGARLAVAVRGPVVFFPAT